MIPLTKKVSKKIKTFTPLLIGLSKQQKEQLKNTPRFALKCLLANKGSSSDLNTLIFRMKWCYETAVDVYNEETQQQIKTVLDVLVKLFETCVKDENDFILNTLTRDEMDLLSIGLDAMDEMQDDVTRKQMLEPSYRARDFLRKLSKINVNVLV